MYKSELVVIMSIESENKMMQLDILRLLPAHFGV